MLYGRHIYRGSLIARTLILVFVAGVGLSLAVSNVVAEPRAPEDRLLAQARTVRGEAFNFLDHELKYGGGYGLVDISVPARGEAFDFLDHELRYAGGYGLVDVSVPARGEAFDFLDHELRYAGRYGLSYDPLIADQ